MTHSKQNNAREQVVSTIEALLIKSVCERGENRMHAALYEKKAAAKSPASDIIPDCFYSRE
jgi:hypothetical protein